MALNIKNPRTVEMVKQLAQHYGLSYTAAIERAAEAALREPSPAIDRDALRRVQRLAAAYRAHRDEPLPDPDDLYNVDGLYR